MSTPLSWHLSAWTATFKCSLFLTHDHFLSCPCISPFFFKLHKSYTSVSSLPCLLRKSLITSTLYLALYHFSRGCRKTETEVVCVSSVSSSSPSSNKLSLEWAGKSPCGLVPSNCNPQHIITMAGSPLHYCSRAEAGGQHTHKHTHTPSPFICDHFHSFASVFHDSPYITWPAPIMNPSEKTRVKLLSCIIQCLVPQTTPIKLLTLQILHSHCLYWGSRIAQPDRLY